MRGEVDFRAKRGSPVRGHRGALMLANPLTRLALAALATLSPQAGRGK
jgi:hypothetical protein